DDGSAVAGPTLSPTPTGPSADRRSGIPRLGMPKTQKPAPRGLVKLCRVSLPCTSWNFSSKVICDRRRSARWSGSVGGGGFETPPLPPPQPTAATSRTNGRRRVGLFIGVSLYRV